MFYRPGPRVVVYALLATVLSVIVQGAMTTALTPFGIPTSTAAFVRAPRLFLLPGQSSSDLGVRALASALDVGTVLIHYDRPRTRS